METSCRPASNRINGMRAPEAALRGTLGGVYGHNSEAMDHRRRMILTVCGVMHMCVLDEVGADLRNGPDTVLILHKWMVLDSLQKKLS